MANVQFSLGQVAITQHLLVNAIKVSAPLAIVTSQSFAPPHPTTRNLLFSGIDPATYYFDFRESPDGIALGVLLARFKIDVKTTTSQLEVVVYKVDAGGVNPVSSQSILTDPYLDGKDIIEVFQEGFRPLVPPAYAAFKEYDFGAGGIITLLPSPITGTINEFQAGQIWFVTINNPVSATPPAPQGMFAGVQNLLVNTTLNNTHYNYRLRCVAGANRMVNTLPSLASTPDGTMFYFHQNDGDQYQTKIITQGADTLKYAKEYFQEMTIAQGEHLWIEKRNVLSVVCWEVIDVHDGFLDVGERIVAGWKDHLNTKPEDGTVYDFDDYPRMAWWVVNKLDASGKISDPLMGVQPVGKEGMFVYHIPTKKFRMPNTQGWYSRGLPNFNTYAAGEEPGRTKPGEVGLHYHDSGTEASDDAKFNRSPVDHTKRHWSAANSNLQGRDSTDNNKKADGVTYAGSENLVKEFGVIYLRKF